MTSLTPEQKEYKERTLEHLLVALPRLETQLAQEKQADTAELIREQLDDIETHVALLQQELAGNVSLEPVADELCKQAANALVKQKFYLARKYVAKLETIEPFYPELDRLRQDAETGQVSRRTRSITQGNLAPLSRAVILPPRPASSLTIEGVTGEPTVAPAAENMYMDEPERGGWRQFLQFHYILSCLVILLILCVMAGVGGVNLLEWLLKGL